MKKLNLGCGEDYKKGWTNLDSRDNIKRDVEWNLDNFPYPFKNNEFDLILMNSVLEHVSDPIKTLKEVIRISKDNCKVIVIVPHADCYASSTDIQHKTRFTENSFNDVLLKEYELEAIKKTKVEFEYNNKWKKFIPFKNILKIFLNGIFEDIKFEFRIKK